MAVEVMANEGKINGIIQEIKESVISEKNLSRKVGLVAGIAMLGVNIASKLDPDGAKELQVKYYIFEKIEKKLDGDELSGFKQAHAYAKTLVGVIGKDKSLAETVFEACELVIAGTMFNEAGYNRCLELIRMK